jgi:hypothetical protein
MEFGESDSAFYHQCNNILILVLYYNNITKVSNIRAPRSIILILLVIHISSLVNATLTFVECHGVQLSSSLQQSRFNEIVVFKENACGIYIKEKDRGTYCSLVAITA